MRRALQAHPGAGPGPVTGVQVEIERIGAGGLRLAYEITGRIDALRLPAPAEPARTDGLWKHTCLEAFLRPDGGEAYLELNFSPSGRWAAYRFSGYREGMRPLEELPPPQIEASMSEKALSLTAVVDLSAAPDLMLPGEWRLGLSAVIEDAEGAITYWALAHPPGKPDFHHPDGFACRVPPPEAA